MNAQNVTKDVMFILRRNMSSKVTERSNCCNAKVKVVGRTTLHYECLKCHEPCDVHFVQRKIWGFNPKTRVKPNIKKVRKEKDKQRKEIQDNEN